MNKNTILKPGDRFGLWTVIKEAAPAPKSKERRYLCRCECGRESEVRVQKLLSGKSTCCGKCPASSLQRIKNYKASNPGTHPGVNWKKKDQRWEATIQYQGKRRYLGQYINQEDAILTREAAERNLENKKIRES